MKENDMKKLEFVIRMCMDGWCESCKENLEDCIKNKTCKGGPIKNGEEKSI